MVLCHLAFSQQRPQFSQYMVNQFVLNPAVAGTEDYVDIKAGYRYQWLGMSGSPITYYISAHTPVGKQFNNRFGRHKKQSNGWHGLGAYIYNDITGPLKHSGAYAAYAYNLGITKDLRISVGAYFGFQRVAINGNQFILHDEQDQVLNGVKSTIVPDLNLATWIYNKHFYYGLSIQQMLNNRLNFGGYYTAIGSNNGKIQAPSRLNYHYFMTAGFKIPFAYDYTFVPSIMVKYVRPAPLSVDLNAKFGYKNELFWFGFSYRVMDSFIGMIGTTLLNGRLPVSYSFDLTHSALIRYNYGSHEIIVGYRIPPKPKVPCPAKFWN